MVIHLRTKAAREVVDGVVVHVGEDCAVSERDVVVAVEGVRHVDAPPCTAWFGESELDVGVEHAVVEQPAVDDVVRHVVLWYGGAGRNS